MQSKPWPFQSRKKKTSEKLTGYSFDQCEGGSLKIYKYSCIVNSQEDTTYNIFLVNVTSYFKPFWLPDNKQPMYANVLNTTIITQIYSSGR